MTATRAIPKTDVLPIARARLRVMALLMALAAAGCVGEEKRGLSIPSPIRQQGFGDPCESDADCVSGPCVPHAGQLVCSQPCAPYVPCPDAWNCIAPPGSSDGAGICASPFASLCRPCRDDLDCSAGVLSKIEGCVDDDGHATFCGTFCTDDSACPEGFTCLERAMVEGEPTRVCSPVDDAGNAERCACNAFIASLDESALCETTNALGTCRGARRCEAGGWTDCDAKVPSPDIPNGVDDDCDGDTDDVTCACGDGTCDVACGETLANCPCDCASKNDGVCSPCGESPATSPEDCCASPGGSGCGDGYCLGFGCGENPTSCPRDCSTPCGNQICERGETPETCAEDCKHQVCGNNVCEPTDDGPTECPQDCAAFCGDCECDPARDESVFNCPIDCGFCGDGVCSICAALNEDSASCREDCCIAAPEFCNGQDDDCDGETDEEGAAGCRDFHLDRDGDGLGRWDVSRCLCAPFGEFRATVFGDCDDTSPAIGAGSPESCDGEDDDCDGRTDEDFGTGEDCDAPSGPCISGEIVCDGPDRTMCVDGPPRTAGALCSELSCEDGVIYPPSVCDGAGVCVALPRAQCNGYACDEIGRCRPSCADDSECRTGYLCTVEGRCERAEGLCASDIECVDEDPQTLDFCLVICTHVSRGDIPPDIDGDGIPNASDGCPETADPAQTDNDGDGVGDACDRCDGVERAEACNGRDDDCDGETDEGLGLGISCSPAGKPCEVGRRVCDDGAVSCEPTGLIATGRTCGPSSCDGTDLRREARCSEAGACEPGPLESCRGFRCEMSGTGAECATTCENECANGFYCVPGAEGGTCAPRLGLGASCSESRQCRGGHCIDGLCCNVACDTPCYSCANEATPGICQPVEAGRDPKDACGPCGLCDGLGHCEDVAPGPSPKAACPTSPPCGGTGQCDAAGACALADEATECAPLRCVDATLTPASRCDGEGTCIPSVAEVCPDGLSCFGDLACRTSCALDRHCREGFFCDELTGACLSLRPLGASCGNDGECDSAFCADGLCCEGRCDGDCMTCAGLEPGRCRPVGAGVDPDNECGLCRTCDGLGACGPVPAGADPADECAVGTTCGATGSCDGTGACALAPDSTACGGAMCVGSTRLEARHCDGLGACADAVLVDCRPYVCADLTACRTTCSLDIHCQSGFFCNDSGTCEARLGLGATCDRASACGSGQCVDGRCCESACAGPCTTCNASGRCEATGSSDPMCGPLTTCVDGGCAGSAGARCEDASDCASGFCVDGSCCDAPCDGACERCATGGCEQVTSAVVPGRCDGGRWCAADGVCEIIDGSACSGDCPAGRVCVLGRCTLPAALGSPCEAAAGCRSGLCVDGMCCASPCDGDCERCEAGICRPLAEGAGDPGCGGGEVCDGAGACRSSDGAACATDSECASGSCVDGQCCESKCDGLCERCEQGRCVGVSGEADPDTCPAPSMCADRDRCASATGQPCSSGADCSSGACVLVTASAGFCCDRPCDGRCETCFGSETGRCEAVTGEENPDRCDTDAWCNPDSECVPKAGGNCHDSTECAAGHFCDPTNGTCAPEATLGAACTLNAGCASGHCADGRCCEVACDGACEVCGANGRCELAETGTDPGGDCAPGETCSREVLGCAGSPGQACAQDDECATGECAEGLCCDRGCDGVCETCLADPGICQMVTNATTESCDAPFACDAGGTCRLGPGARCENDSACASQRCAAGSCCAVGCEGLCEHCGSDGSCGQVTGSENPERCDGAKFCDEAGQCAFKSRACEGASDCSSDYRCEGGFCVPDGELGEACRDDAECLSGACREEVCCESDCSGTCETCARPGYVGKCVPAEVGANPRGECGEDKACGAKQSCVGQTGVTCGQGVECLSGHCVDGVCCDSACASPCEACNTPDAVGVCVATDGPDPACGSGRTCVSGACLSALGASCGFGSECASDKCADSDNLATFTGICCDSGCDGVCANCVSGHCESLRRKSDAACGGEGQWCDMNGQCRAMTGSRCEGDDDCPTTHACLGSVCEPLKELGAPCAGGDECGSGFCADGRCCGSACDGPCDACGETGLCGGEEAGVVGGCGVGKACNAAGECRLVTGSPCTGAATCASGQCVDGVCCGSRCDGVCERCEADGVCRAVLNGQDPGICDGPLMCGAAGTCRFRNGLGCSLDSQCASGHCTEGTCCDSTCGGPCVTCTMSGRTGQCSTTTFEDDALCPPGTWCGAGGVCVDPVAQPCTSNAECPDGLVCLDPNGGGVTICSPPFSTGGLCTQDGQCDSGHCVDGVCCQTACNEACERCDEVAGMCTPTSGADPLCASGQSCVSGNCQATPQPDCPQSCGPGTVCVGGTCEVSSQSSCATPADCASNTCVNNICVDSAPGGFD